MKNKRKREKEKKRWNGLYFLGLVIILYLFLFCLNFENAYHSLKASGDILIKLIPVLFLVMFLMGLLNYFLKPKAITKYLGKSSGARGWVLSVIAGIISHGPIYAWYPLLQGDKNPSFASDDLLLWGSVCCDITHFHGNRISYRGKNHRDV